MSEHGIKTQADLLEKIDKAKQRVEVYERDIQDLRTQGDKLNKLRKSPASKAGVLT